MVLKMVKEHCGCFLSEEGLGIRVIVGQQGEGICAASLENKHKDIGRDLDRRAGLPYNGKKKLCAWELTCFSRVWNSTSSISCSGECDFLPVSAIQSWSRCSRKLFTSVRNTWLELLALASRSVDMDVFEMKGSLLCTWSTPHLLALS